MAGFGERFEHARDIGRQVGETLMTERRKFYLNHAMKRWNEE
ncbi:hypothetical protein Z945_1630 [Sulfitobacter noctilucae]|nr:hypothetical protein Z945_1630 [Sulfitobacter noctilucae]